MPNKVGFAFGDSENLDVAIEQGTINPKDVLFMDGDTKNPKVGWVSDNGKAVVIDVDSKVDAAVKTIDNTYEKRKYKIADAPVGTLVNYGEKEIRIMCPADAVYNKQNVGAGGNKNNYYITLKVYAPNDDIVGYIEHIGDNSDSEILTSFSVDEYGRRYQPTWLSVAAYDETTDTWTYYGASSSAEKYIGWDYQIDWYDANGMMVASDAVRINLTNEQCHHSVLPSYSATIVNQANTYTDEQIKKVAIKVSEF